MGKKNLSLTDRAQAITLMQEGYTSKHEAERFNVHNTTINRLMKHYERHEKIEANTTSNCSGNPSVRFVRGETQKEITVSPV